MNQPSGKVKEILAVSENMEQFFNPEEDDKEMWQLLKGEEKLLDLQKEHFNNVRTLITVAAAIASVDLLAMQALETVGLADWFLGSVILLYVSSICFVIYLNIMINSQTKYFVERGKMADSVTHILNSNEIPLLEKEGELLKSGIESANTILRNVSTTRETMKILAIGNSLFIIGLFVPVLGFIISLFK